jgi:hypothetical protein
MFRLWEAQLLAIDVAVYLPLLSVIIIQPKLKCRNCLTIVVGTFRILQTESDETKMDGKGRGNERQRLEEEQPDTVDVAHQGATGADGRQRALLCLCLIIINHIYKALPEGRAILYDIPRVYHAREHA